MKNTTTMNNSDVTKGNVRITLLRYVVLQCKYSILLKRWYLYRLSPLKSSSLDFLPSSLLKSCPAVFSDLITHLANMSFNQGHFPTLSKPALVTPLQKKPGLDKSLPSNYRPISNLNTISKILER